MKTIVSFIIAACLLAGCVTNSQLNYKTLAAVGMSVDKAMSAAADATAQGKVSDADWERIYVIHAKFLIAYNEACELAKYDLTKLSPEKILQLEREVVLTIGYILNP